MDPVTDALFVERISSFESRLLDPIIDQSSLTTFNSQWSIFADDLQQAIDAEALSMSTISLSHALAERISGVIQTFSDLDAISENLMSALAIETTNILEDLSAPFNTSQMADLEEAINPLKSVDKPSLPSHIQLSYDWLLNNLHNPYPSTVIRNQIADKTKSSRKDIDGWFIDVRKRIGWNTLRKKHFSNKRIDIVEAATRFFIPKPTQPCNAPAFDVAFATIETTAQNLYSDRFIRSELATQLDKVVKDMTPEMKAQAKIEHRRKLAEKKENQAIHDRSCTSPSRSPSSSLISLFSEDDLETTLQPICQSSRKRRASSTDLLDSSSEDSSKRRRISTSPHSSTTALTPPNPSFHGSLATDHGTHRSTELQTLSTAVYGSGRKRRLSDVVDHRPPKRPQLHHAGISLQVTSNCTSFPGTLSGFEFDKWFSDRDEFLNPSDIESGISAPLEVELYDFPELNDENQFGGFVQYPSPQILDYDTLLPMTEPSDIQSLDLSGSAFDFDELFSLGEYSQKLGTNVSFITESPYSRNELPYSRNSGSAANSFDIYTARTQPKINDQAFIVDSSSPVSNNPAINPDWAFPSFISFSLPVNNPGEKLQNFPNTFPLSVNTFNLSTTAHSNSEDPPDLYSDSQLSAHAERAAKQRKLFEIKETARQLEAELATTPY